jgi:PAS domain S-box-containing protein
MGKKQTYDGHDQRVKELEREVQESRRAKEELQRSEENARALLNAPPEWSVLIDSKGVVLDINNVGANMVGRSREDLIGKVVYDLFPPKVAQFREARVKDVLRVKKSLRFIEERDEMVFDVNVHPILDDRGKVDRMAIFAKEITAQKQGQ